MEIRILGPLEMVTDGGPVDVPSGKERLLLAALVVHANRVVSTDRLIEILWHGQPPVTAANTLQTYVSHLRRTLEPDRTPRQQSRIVISREPGYLLAVDPDVIDAARFERLVGQARQVLQSAPDAAAALLRTALSLWRGEPLADFTFDPFAQPEITRLTELRLTALEDRIEAELALGEHGAVSSELAQLVREHPLRERLSGQLMVALYRSGRQAEALRAYAHVREALVEQLGIDPSPALRRLEEAILRQAPELDWPQAVIDPSLGPMPFATADDGPAERRLEDEQEILFCHATDGTRIANSVVGSGPPLVKAANWMTHLDYDRESPLRRHWTEDIAVTRALLRYDERGCGMSDWNVDRFDFDAWVEDLEVVVDSAKLDRFPLLGVSQGAAVAVAFAVRHPERVSRMVSTGPTPAAGAGVPTALARLRRRLTSNWPASAGTVTTRRSARCSRRSSSPTAVAPTGTSSTNYNAGRPRRRTRCASSRRSPTSTSLPRRRRYAARP
jgi:DNA-binding SARP family transcriptional activator/pimeloyl-ACP methyl ester carboxylesterase